MAETRAKAVDQAKLFWYHALQSTVYKELLKFNNKAEDSMARGMQIQREVLNHSTTQLGIMDKADPRCHVEITITRGTIRSLKMPTQAHRDLFGGNVGVSMWGKRKLCKNWWFKYKETTMARALPAQRITHSVFLKGFTLSVQEENLLLFQVHPQLRTYKGSIPSSVDQILQNELNALMYRVLAYLLLGVVRIYSRKVDFLFDDCNKALTGVKEFVIKEKDREMCYCLHLRDFHGGNVKPRDDITLRDGGPETESMDQYYMERFDMEEDLVITF